MRRRTFLAASGLVVALPPHAQGGGKLVHSVDELGAAIARAVRRPTYRPLMPTDAGPHAR